MGAFKDQIGAESVDALAAALEGLAGFDAARFRRAAVGGLEPLELKARIAHVAGALDDALAVGFPVAAPSVAAAVAASPLTTWQAWPAQTWVEERGVDHPEVALAAIGAMTARASGESAVRPFLHRHPRPAWRAVHEWAGASDADRRRLASEGTRPRLPWARSVPALLSDPAPGIAVIDRLREDPEEYVRRSVANHLNDVARDHPGTALATAGRWHAEGGRHVERILRHGLRGLVKKGDPSALALLGFEHGAAVEVGEIELEETTVAIGGELQFAAEIRCDSAARVAIDYAITYIGAHGRAKAPKVFKGAVRDLSAGERWRFVRRHPMREVSIRRLHPGTHRVDLQVNGVMRAGADFRLDGPGSPSGS